MVCRRIISGGNTGRLVSHSDNTNDADTLVDHPVDYIQPIYDITVDAGDTVRMSIWAYTPTTGAALLENLTKGTHYQINITGGDDVPLCFKTAEWIVEDVGYGDGYAPFPNYTTVTFTDTYTNLGAPSSPEYFA
jgi:hypothetical protein